MHTSRGKNAGAMALVGTAVFGARFGVHAIPSNCSFRFEGYLNISEPPTWTVPAAEPFAENYTVLNEGAPFVYFVSDTEGERVNCTSTAWQYFGANDTRKTEVAFPDEEPTNATAFEELFIATNGSYLKVAAVPAERAVAVSDSLYGWTIQINLTCDQDAVVEEEDSCVIFEVDFTNYSPLPDVSTALYRFEDPAVPAFLLPEAQPISPGDIQLNVDNPITDLDGSETDTGCNGDIAEYLGEDGEWYFWYTGSNGNMYNLTHVFYAANVSHLNIATIQENWSTNMEAALYNRTVRLLIHCNNAANFQEGYLFFRVGEFDTAALEDTCESLPSLCVEAASNSAAASTIRYMGGAGYGGLQKWITTAAGAVAMVVASAFMVETGMFS